MYGAARRSDGTYHQEGRNDFGCGGDQCPCASLNNHVFLDRSGSDLSVYLLLLAKDRSGI